MAKVYTLAVRKDKLALATDMLRYDQCFEVRSSGEDYLLKCLQYTQGRWESFNVRPALSCIDTCTAREWTDYQTKADGFIEALRFGQDIINTERWQMFKPQRFVEGSINQS